MSDRRQPIETYISRLASRLHLPAAERDALLAEVHGHLDERAAALRNSGLAAEQAERQAVQAFGDVRDISRQLGAAHPQTWEPLRWIVGLVTGAAVTWVLWLAGTVPAMAYYFTLHPLFLGDPHGQSHPLHVSPLQILVASSPVSSGAFQAYLTLGWLWLLSLLALYLVVPFLWGRGARRWWTPGLAYGLGAWLSAPWFVIGLISADWAFSAEGRIIALALPLALLASFAGWSGRQRSASADAPALAA